MWFSEQHLDEMDNRFRVNFINSLSGFKSANLIGTDDGHGHHNLAIFSSVVHLGANPALMGFINRPDTVDRHTLQNIRDTEQFTINAVNGDIFGNAHQTSARYPRHLSEFDCTQLTPVAGKLISAPYVLESRLRVGLQLVDEIKLKINGTHLVIGEIVEVYAEKESLNEDGYIDVEQLNTVCLSGLDSYHQTNKITRLPYAKVAGE